MYIATVGVENKGRDFIRTGSLSFESEITNLDNHIYIMSTARMVMSLITNATKHGRNVSLPGAHIVYVPLALLQYAISTSGAGLLLRSRGTLK